MNIFKKVSMLLLTLTIVLPGLFGSTSIYAADTGTAPDTAISSAAPSDSGTSVQSDTYGQPDNGGTDTTPGGNTAPPSTNPGTDTQTPATPAADTYQNIITRVFLTDASQNVIDGQVNPNTQIDPDAPVYLNYEWALPDDGSYHNGSTFEYDLPSAFQLYNDITNVPLQFENGTVGSFSATRSGHVTMTFNDTIEQYSNVHGTMQFRTAFSQEVTHGSTEVQIPVPVNGDSQFILVYFKPDKGTSISKRGQAVDQNHIEWTIDVNTTKEKLENAVVTDPIAAGMSLDTSSIQLYELNVNVDGTTTPGQKLTSGYQLESDSSSFKLTFDQAIRSAYRITYVTNITADAQSKFTNTASFASNKGTLTAKAEVSVQQQFLTKKVESYDEQTGIISWSIGYNFNSRSIPQDQAVLQDRFNASQELVKDSIKVYNATTNTLLTEGQDYTVTPVAIKSGRTGFDLKFLYDINSPYTIKYQTQPVNRVDKDEKVTNTVTSGGATGTASQVIKNVVFTKVLSDANYIRKDATWKLTLNRDGYPMSNAIINDTFPNSGLEFQKDSLQIQRADGSIYPASSYTVSSDNLRSGFKITFLTDLTEPLTITYRTLFNADWKKDKTDVSFLNHSQLSWIENGKTRTADAEARFWPDSMTVNNGSKDGWYNATTKQITWNIKANYSSRQLTSASIEDMLEPGQSYVPGSLQVNHMNLVGVWNSVTRGKTVAPSDYTVVVPADGEDGGKLQVRFNKPINSPYWITFKTTLDNHVVKPVIRNNAVLSSDQAVYPWAASVSIPKGGEYVSKTGTQDGDKIYWTVYINRGQSYVENARITDQPTPNQILLTDSFNLYSASVASNGGLAKGTKLVRGTDYKLSITAGSPEQFELTFLKPIRSAMILEYTSMITAEDREQIGNSVQFAGDGITTGTIDTTKEIIVRTSSASGTGTGVVGNLIVSKVDKDDAALPLEGATFVLQDAAKARPAITVTTDPQGRALFTRLLYGNYTLQETIAPAGYTLDPTVHTVTINSSIKQTSNALFLTLTNTKQPVVPPGNPDNPGTPGNPDNPGNPGNPGTPDNPGNPGNPGSPTDNKPDNDKPGTPGTPPGGGNPSGGTPVTEPTIPVEDEPTPSGTVDPTPSNPSVLPDTSPPVPGNPAEPDMPIPDEPVPSGTVPPAPAQQPDIPLSDEPVPQGTTQPDRTPSQQQPMLPQTGESSRMPFWLTGAALLAMGLVLYQVQAARRRSAERGTSGK